MKTLYLISDKPDGKDFLECITKQGCPPGSKLKLRVDETGNAFRHLIVRKKHKMLVFMEYVCM